jgi:Flp pilus assembly protein TadB
MRSKLRTVVCGVVAVIIVIAWVAEPPGTVEAVGLAVVFVAMILVVLREIRASR